MSDSAVPPAPADAAVDVPVLIAGGGCAGLTASMLLSGLGVGTWLACASPETSVLPKAHVLSQRTMEIFRDVALAESVYELSTPPENMSHAGWYAGLAGDREEYGRRCGRIEAWGAGGANPAWAAASACRPANLPQIRLEPLLRRRAEELAPGCVHFGHEVTGFEEDEDGVTATVVDRSRDSAYRVRARYLLACDGGRLIGPSLGVGMEGADDIARMVSVHFSADLSELLEDDEVLVRWLWLPESGVGVSLVPMGPRNWGRRSEEWVVHLNGSEEPSTSLDDEAVVAELRESLGLRDHELSVHRITRWRLEGVVAERYRVGRVFLLGDAAHRHPPTGGFGLNSAVQDAHNLAWKLAAVLHGHAGDGLLGSYEDERKRIAAWNVQHAVNNAVNHLMAVQAMGMGPGSDPEANWAALHRLWGDEEKGANPGDGPAAAPGEHAAEDDAAEAAAAGAVDVEDAENAENTAFRVRALRAIAGQSMEFDALGLDYGYTYEVSDAVIADGTPVPDNPDPVRIYRPGTRPGAPLPHAWLDSPAGARLPVADLVRPGAFLLIAGEEGEEWVAAAEKTAESLEVPLEAVRVGHLDGDFLDPRSAWVAHRGVGPRGAVLVRPDRFVAWRYPEGVQDAVGALTDALARVLDRADGAPGRETGQDAPGSGAGAGAEPTSEQQGSGAGPVR
ncbi:FAD-dependent monooxygenase [Streptomyces winkii]|uniref:FAD-dependent monooxygenase n=1 Tax=Streptomyces winkii TaxID=3051178 RepID=UPI0028D6906E|nr:FAD-dependent monooxygenase [Streptomyces sp. DSM 40971]